LNGDMIVVYDRNEHRPVLWTHLVPCTLGGHALHNVQNAMFATAIAYSMGVPVDALRNGLTTFDTTFHEAPGRMNVYDELPFKVIMDYGHNPAAIQAMCGLTDALRVSGRRIVVLAAPGDRRDEDIVEIGRSAAGHFDHYICRRDDGRRGRGVEEVPRLLRGALLEAGVPAETIELVPEESRAVDRALGMARAGDLVLLFADALQRTWSQVTRFEPEGGRPRRRAEAAPEPLPVEQASGSAGLADGRAFVRDSRGVRLAGAEPEIAD
jgi:cyanophycin synthetase